MVIGVSVISCCLIYSILLMIIYFSKQRLENMENKIYGVMVVINIFGLILELLCCYYTYKNGESSISSLLCFICNRLFIIYMLTWLFVFTFYIFYITFSKQVSIKQDLDRYKKIFLKVATFIYAVLFLLAMVLPIYYFNDGTYVYSYGPATSLLVAFGGASILFDIFCVVKNRKNIRSKQYYPLFVFILLMIIVLIIRNINPGIILINSTFAFITMLMYFTIENPDVQMISELYKNKKLIESSNEGTSRFLFKLTQDIKKPALELKKISNEMALTSDKDKLKEYATYTNNYSNQLDYLINDALNISNMNTQKIKIFDAKYNIYRLFKEINIHYESMVQDGVTFKGNMDNSIPTYLYGDCIKLKQIINSIINNSIKNTNSGFINFEISSIIKYDICRLFITVEDSGKGMDIEKINVLMSLNDDSMNNIDMDKIQDKNDLNYKEIKKIVSLLGGAILIKGEENKGLSVVITLDQKIVPNENVKMVEKLESYEQFLHSGIKCLVIDEDESELKHITDLLKSKDYNVDSSVFEMDCIDKLSKKMKYDFIILDDEMPNYNAIDILKKLKENKDFKTPVMVMINDNKERIKLQYLRDGFADYILKSKLDSEIKRVTKRF